MKKLIPSFFVFLFSFFIFQVGVAQIIHVPADRGTIQTGIDAANDGDTVLVADGTYLENISFMGKAITVASQFLMDGDTNHINNTIIDGSQPANPDTASVVRFCHDEDTTSVLCGFTITGGGGTLDAVYSAMEGGGIYCWEASAKIIHNKITGNQVEYEFNAWGGGIMVFFDTGYQWTVIEHNIISGNECIAGTGSAEGGGIEVSGDARISYNLIAGNHCSTSSGINDGGGVYHFSNGGMLLLLSNNITNNTLSATTTARGGGVITFYSHCIISDNIISNNSITGDMTNGAGILLREPASASLFENTISNNSVSTSNIYWGAGCELVMPAGPAFITYNEFSGNTGPIEVNTGVGGGLAVMDAEMNILRVSHNIFKDNIGRFGGGYYSRSSYNQILENNIMEGNLARVGGAIGLYIPASSEVARPVLINNTVVDNTGNDEGGAARLNCETNPPIFFNCLFYGNSAPIGNDINYIGSTEPIVISYCNVNQGGVVGSWTGICNFNADPGFLPGDAMFHLSLTSPCKNAGTDSLVVNGVTYFVPLSDIDGESRPDPQYGKTDVGSDERWDTPPAPLALDPEVIGADYFVARWEPVILAMTYRIDLAYDMNFSQMVEGYDNLDVGSNTEVMISGLEALTYFYRVRACNALNTSQSSNVIEVLGVRIKDPAVCSSQFAVRAYPNPFSNQTTIEFYLPEDAQVALKLYDLTGREVRSLITGHLEKGENRFILNADELKSGIYILRLTANCELQTANCKLVVQ